MPVFIQTIFRNDNNGLAFLFKIGIFIIGSCQKFLKFTKIMFKFSQAFALSCLLSLSLMSTRVIKIRSENQKILMLSTF